MQAQHRTTPANPARRLLAGGLPALAAFLALGACTAGGTGGGTVYFSNFTAGYVPSSVAAAHPLLVETYGSPAPDLTQAAVTRASVEGLRESGPAWMPRGYSGNPLDVPKPAYRLRIAYGVPKSFNGQQLCKEEMAGAALEAARGPGEAAATRTIAGLCRGTNAVAYAEGSPGVTPDVSGARFRSFVGLLGRRLMPRQNPVTKDDCILRRCD